MAALGSNPMRWVCERDGCFNEQRRPKIEVFAACFPRRINFGDVDGLVELNGKFCLLEWKGDGGSVRTGQRISFQQFTMSFGNVVFIVSGNASTMDVQSYSMCWKGKLTDPMVSNLEGVKNRIKNWASWAEAQPRRVA